MAFLTRFLLWFFSPKYSSGLMTHDLNHLKYCPEFAQILKLSAYPLFWPPAGCQIFFRTRSKLNVFVCKLGFQCYNFSILSQFCFMFSGIIFHVIIFQVMIFVNFSCCNFSSYNFLLSFSSYFIFPENVIHSRKEAKICFLFSL